MADAVTIDIEGVDELLKQFNVARRDRSRVEKQAMGDAAKACARYVKGKTPSRWKSLIASKPWISRDGTVGASFGASRKSKEWDWKKSYWLNYGTYSKRDPQHQYRNARKRKTAGWGKGGAMNTKYYHFFEQALPGYEGIFRTAFDKAIVKRIEQLFK